MGSAKSQTKETMPNIAKIIIKYTKCTSTENALNAAALDVGACAT